MTACFVQHDQFHRQSSFSLGWWDFSNTLKRSKTVDGVYNGDFSSKGIVEWKNTERRGSRTSLQTENSLRSKLYLIHSSSFWLEWQLMTRFVSRELRA